MPLRGFHIVSVTYLINSHAFRVWSDHYSGVPAVHVKHFQEVGLLLNTSL